MKAKIIMKIFFTKDGFNYLQIQSIIHREFMTWILLKELSPQKTNNLIYSNYHFKVKMKLILLLALILIVQKENQEFNNQVIMFHRKITSFLLLITLFLQGCSLLTMMEVESSIWINSKFVILKITKRTRFAQIVEIIYNSSKKIQQIVPITKIHLLNKSNWIISRFHRYWDKIQEK